MKNIILAIFALQLTTLGCHAQSQRSSYIGAALSFRTPVRVPVGTHPLGVMIADVNKDGKRDLIVANGGSDNLVGGILTNQNASYLTICRRTKE